MAQNEAKVIIHEVWVPGAHLPEWQVSDAVQVAPSSHGAPSGALHATVRVRQPAPSQVSPPHGPAGRQFHRDQQLSRLE